jgi:hypothetical protein
VSAPVASPNAFAEKLIPAVLDEADEKAPTPSAEPPDR